MKLISYYYDNLPTALKVEFAWLLEDAGIKSAYVEEHKSRADAEIITNSKGTIFDFRVFDPYHVLSDDLYTYPDGWSNWMMGFVDNQD